MTTSRQKRPAWHGVRVGDRVRFRYAQEWLTVTALANESGLLPDVRIVCVAPRINAKHSRREWLTDIAERRARR